MFEEDAASDGIVEGVVWVSAGGECLCARAKVEGVEDVVECGGGQGGVDLSYEFQGIDKLFGCMEGESGGQVTPFGRGIVRNGDGVGEDGGQLGPQIGKRGGCCDLAS
jgi:hypothetical protein